MSPSTPTPCSASRHPASRLPPPFDPGAALTALDALAIRLPGAEADATWDEAWDAAWIACTTNSPRWAETARLRFLRASTAGTVVGSAETG